MPSTRLIDYMPHIEQGLMDLINWVENGVEPIATVAEYKDGKLYMPATADERGGIQPVVHAKVNGAERADIQVGERVTLEVAAAVPEGTGTIVAVEWDFDGTGKYPHKHDEVDGKSRHVRMRVNHAFEKAGTYFPAVRVVSHREGDLNAENRRIENLGRARVVVA